MTIYITLDYELFFGAKSGTIDNCIIKPTQALLNIVDPLGIKFTCFVDSGYLLALEKQKKDHKELQEDYNKVTTQIKQLSQEGHGIELHVHPHWEDSYYDGKKWIINTERYKLSDFAQQEINDIVTRYNEVLHRITGLQTVAYRAGGWSAQPFAPIQKALMANNVLIDSSVYPRGSYTSENQEFDFREVTPFTTKYQFDDNLTKEVIGGKFTEIPISSYKVSPLFFWKFAFKKLLKKPKDLPYGDGSAVSMSKQELIRLLTSFSYSVVSIDGYKSSLLKKAFRKYQKHTKNKGEFVLIGHPKAFTNYSLIKLKQFIEKEYKNHKFLTYRN